MMRGCQSDYSLLDFSYCDPQAVKSKVFNTGAGQKPQFVALNRLRKKTHIISEHVPSFGRNGCKNIAE